ncbi:MAG: hypothetical protein WA885_19725 [Phormidesmis sp.]
MQERFEALLKQRLLSEYEHNPPLFPWESEVREYPAEIADFEPTAAAAGLWNAHVSALKVSGLLPKHLLNALFERCQGIAREPMKQGVQLVRAVEALFPEQADILEPIANMVLVPAYRSDRATQEAVTQELVNVAGGYDSALPEQQIALSMLAAREILSALTLFVNPENPGETRSWITALGVLKLSVNYAQTQLTIAAVLPEGGELRLGDGDIEKRAMRSTPGSLDLIWAHPQSAQTYALAVTLADEAQPLNFVIKVADRPLSAHSQS